MKTKRLLRVLSLLGFLLLLAPFYDSCNGHRMKQAEANTEAAADTTAVEIDSTKIVATQIDSTEITTTKVDTISNSEDNNEPSIVYKAYKFIDDEDSQSAVEFTIFSIDYLSDFDPKDFRNILERKDGHWVIFFQLKNFCFLLIVISSLLILIVSFKNERLTHKFSILNLILLLITIICLFVEGLFETISQIKWGYYAFILVNLLIFYYSRKPSVKQT